MKIVHMLRYITKLLILFLPATGFSQVVADTVITAKEPPVIVPKAERYGLRVGIDLNKIAKGFYTDNYRGLEVVGDYRLTKKIYLAGELGNEDFTVDDKHLNFTTKGTYFKVGFDFNAYENWLDMENMIYAGFRYGFSSFSQTLNSYNIYDNRLTVDGVSYLDETVVYPNREYTGLSAHWAEVVGGVKAELFDNLYLGFSVRLNFLITDKKPENFDNLYIPGFNRTYDGNFGAGFNYTVSYFIPLYKKSAKPKTETTE